MGLAKTSVWARAGSMRVLIPSGLALALGMIAVGAHAEDGAPDRTPWKLATPAPLVRFAPERVADIDAISCTRCHAAVVQEWAGTAHALAWVDTQYQERLADMKKPAGCYGCHAPQPLSAVKEASKPPARDALREHGVDCAACHLGAGGEMLGPRGTATEAHASAKSERFVGAGSSALCVGCHRTNIGPVIGIAKDFEQSKRAERGESCVGCHCAEVELEFTRVPSAPGEAPVEAAASTSSVGKRTGRSHMLQTPRDPAFLRRAFEFALREANGVTVVRVANKAGHRVPGLIGRTLTFEAEGFDAGGRSMGKGRLVIDAAAYLPVDGELEIPLSARAARVRVVGVHEEPRADAPVTFVDVTVEP